MFANTGSRKIKSIFSVVFDYEWGASSYFYSRQTLNLICGKIEKLALQDPLSITEEKINAERVFDNRAFKKHMKPQLQQLMETMRAHGFDQNHRLIFSYASPDKKKKTHRVNFYIMPMDNYGKIVDNPHGVNSPYSNMIYYLRSDRLIPNIIVSGRVVEDKSEEVDISPIIPEIFYEERTATSVEFNSFYARFKRRWPSLHFVQGKICLYKKTATDKIKTRCLNPQSFDFLPDGYHLIQNLSTHTNEILYIDRVKFGSKNDPYLMILDYEFKSELADEMLNLSE